MQHVNVVRLREDLAARGEEQVSITYAQLLDDCLHRWVYVLGLTTSSSKLEAHAVTSPMPMHPMPNDHNLYAHAPFAHAPPLRSPMPLGPKPITLYALMIPPEWWRQCVHLGSEQGLCLRDASPLPLIPAPKSAMA